MGKEAKGTTVDDILDEIETATDDCQVIKGRREQRNSKTDDFQGVGKRGVGGRRKAVRVRWRQLTGGGRRASIAPSNIRRNLPHCWVNRNRGLGNRNRDQTEIGASLLGKQLCGCLRNRKKGKNTWLVLNCLDRNSGLQRTRRIGSD